MLPAGPAPTTITSNRFVVKTVSSLGKELYGQPKESRMQAAVRDPNRLAQDLFRPLPPADTTPSRSCCRSGRTVDGGGK